MWLHDIPLYIRLLYWNGIRLNRKALFLWTFNMSCKPQFLKPGDVDSNSKHSPSSQSASIITQGSCNVPSGLRDLSTTEGDTTSTFPAGRWCVVTRRINHRPTVSWQAMIATTEPLALALRSITFQGFLSRMTSAVNGLTAGAFANYILLVLHSRFTFIPAYRSSAYRWQHQRLLV
jgi:hypothetical protein